jgi:Tol biopolymer transport system component
MSSLTPGRRFGPYEVLGPIGAGGMGEVYRARDTRLGREVALKVLPPTIASDRERLGRFEREAHLLASLNHPNIGAIYGVEDAGGAPALVLELIEGPTLADRLSRGPMPPEEAIPVARQIAEALEYAHEKGVVHRDLKPANIKLDPEGRVKILDFGLAKAAAGDTLWSQSSPEHSPTLTSLGSIAGAIIGTAAYMSPEQARGAQVDRRADIWAFGAVLWEMLTGKRAFEGETISDTLASVLRAPIDWGEIPSGTPPLVVGLLRRCLERDAKKRLRDIGEVRILLDAPASDVFASGILAGPAGASGILIPGAGGAAGAAAGGAARAPARAARLVRLAPWVLAALLGGAFILAAARGRRPEAAAPLVRFEMSPPEALTSIRWPRLSPDGRLIAFVGRDGSGKNAIWIRPVDSFDAYPLNGTESAGRPFWSPDSRYLAYFSGTQLTKGPVAGGPTQIICEAQSGSDGSWGSSGVILFDGGTNDPIRRCPASGGLVSDQAKPDSKQGEAAYAWPLFLPDGKHYLFTVDKAGGGASGRSIHVGSLDDTASKDLGPTDTRVEFGSGYLVYAAQGTLLAQKFDDRRLVTQGDPIPLASGVISADPGYFSVSSDGALAYMAAGVGTNSDLVWIDRQGRELGNEGGPGGYRDFALSPDGGRLAYGLMDGRQTDIWIRDLRRGVAMRLTTDPKDDVWPVWSPDGTRIVFASNRGGTYALMEKSSSGTGAEEKIYENPGANSGPTSWTSDGRWIGFSSYPSGAPPQVFLLRAEGKHEAVPFLTESFPEVNPMFSPDGRWIAYVSSETGRSEVYVQPYPATGAKWAVSNGGGSAPCWRGDGKELFYQGPDDTVYAVPVTLGASFDAGEPKSLFHRRLEKTGIVRNRWIASQDGQRFLVAVTQEERSAAPFSIVLNWTRGLTQH